MLPAIETPYFAKRSIDYGFQGVGLTVYSISQVSITYTRLALDLQDRINLNNKYKR